MREIGAIRISVWAERGRAIEIRIDDGESEQPITLFPKQCGVIGARDVLGEIRSTLVVRLGKLLDTALAAMRTR